jgi:hypothetical protein
MFFLAFRLSALSFLIAFLTFLKSERTGLFLLSSLYAFFRSFLAELKSFFPLKFAVALLYRALTSFSSFSRTLVAYSIAPL